MNIIPITPSKLDKLKPLIKDYKYKNFYNYPGFSETEKSNYMLYELSTVDKILAVEKDKKVCAFGWVKKSDWDSSHFGFNMAEIGLVSNSRYIIDHEASSLLLKELERYCIRQEIKHITIRLPLNHTALIHAAEENDFQLMAQVTSYVKNLHDYRENKTNEQIKIKACTSADLERLSHITSTSFRPKSGWYDRFHSDPVLPDRKADLLYKEWINNCYREYKKKKDSKIFVAYYKNKLVGYIAVEIDKDASNILNKKIAYIPLNAVDEKYRRKGIYAKLVAETLSWLKKKGVDLVYIVTQSGTIGVQKVWMKEKKVYTHTKCVFHKFIGQVDNIIVAAYHNIGYLCLNELLKKKENVVAVFTHRDSPDEIIWFKSVKKIAQKHNIPVFTPRDINDPANIKLIKELKPDIIFSFMFRRLFKENLLRIPKYGCLNLHPSLLPKYRGRSPINWILINGEEVTGTSLHYMEPQADSGDIIAQKKIKIKKTDDVFTLHNRVAKVSLEMFKEVFPLIKHNNVKRAPQDHREATYFKGRGPQDGHIDWNKEPQENYNFIRALTYPFPGAFGFCKNKKIIIWKAKLATALSKKINDKIKTSVPGQIIELDEKNVTVRCKNGVLVVTQLQLNEDNERFKLPGKVLKENGISDHDILK